MNLLLKLTAVFLTSSSVNSQLITCGMIALPQSQGIVPCSLRTYRRPYTNDKAKIISTKTQRGVLSSENYNTQIVNNFERPSLDQSVLSINIPVQNDQNHFSILQSHNYENAPNIGFYPWPYPTPAKLGQAFVPNSDPYPGGFSVQTSAPSKQNSASVAIQTTSSQININGPTTNVVDTQINQHNSSQNQIIINNLSSVQNPISVVNSTNLIDSNTILNQNLLPTPTIDSSLNDNSNSLNSNLLATQNNNRFVLGQGLNLANFLNATDLAILGCDEKGNC